MRESGLPRWSASSGARVFCSSHANSVGASGHGEVCVVLRRTQISTLASTFVACLCVPTADTRNLPAGLFGFFMGFVSTSLGHLASAACYCGVVHSANYGVFVTGPVAHCLVWGCTSLPTSTFDGGYLLFCDSHANSIDSVLLCQYFLVCGSPRKESPASAECDRLFGDTASTCDRPTLPSEFSMVLLANGMHEPTFSACDFLCFDCSNTPC